MGMGGDYRAQDKGTYVRKLNHWGMCMGSASRSQNVSTHLCIDVQDIHEDIIAAIAPKCNIMTVYSAVC